MILIKTALEIVSIKTNVFGNFKSQNIICWEHFPVGLFLKTRIINQI